jgi:glycosyltransferase involved in cell wall biosynthesis
MRKGTPVNLHITHSWGGGLGRWVRDFATADERSANLVLQSRGSQHAYGLGLRLADPATQRELDRWVLEQPISEVASAHSEHRRILEDVLRRFEVSHLYVSSLVGHSLEPLRRDVPTTVVQHDYFPYCPALYLTREGTCTRCGSHELDLCTRQNRYFRPANPPPYYADLRAAYFDVLIDRRPTLVAPTASVVRNLRRIDRRFAGLSFHVIEHGCALPRRDLFAGATDGRRLRVAVLGRIDPVKGDELLAAAFERARLVVDFLFLGAGQGGSALSGRWASTVVPSYRHEDLPALLADRPCDLALFLSAVPESFSYTLSEAWALGIPVVAPRIGAFEDRITDGETGFLYDPERDSLVHLLLQLDGDRSAVRRMAKRIAARPLRDPRRMVEDYYALRRDVRAIA